MRVLSVVLFSCLALGLWATEGGEAPVTPDAPDLRRLRWGMTPGEVGKLEGLSNLAAQSTNRLVFRETLAGLPLRVEFHFSPENGLVMADYLVPSHPARLDEAYPLLRSGLVKKYGEPRDVREGRFGASLHGECTWETPRTRIELLRSGAILRVRYTMRREKDRPLPVEVPAADLEKL